MTATLVAAWNVITSVFFRIHVYFRDLRVVRVDYAKDTLWLARWNDVNAFPIAGTRLEYLRRNDMVRIR